jgi:hypothetical protein
MMQSVFTFILYRVILDTSTAIICLDNFGALLLLTSFVSIASVYFYRWHVMRCVGRRQKTKIGRSITAKRILLVVYSYTCIKSRSGKERRMRHISGMLSCSRLIFWNARYIYKPPSGYYTDEDCLWWLSTERSTFLLTSMLIIYFTWNFIFICFYLTFERIIPTAVKPQNPESFF